MELPETSDFASANLFSKMAEIRASKINWQPYLQSQLISADDFEFIQRFTAAGTEQRRRIAEIEGTQCAQTLLHLVTRIVKESVVHFVLVLIEDLLQENGEHAQIFSVFTRRNHRSQWVLFMPMLNRQEILTMHLKLRAAVGDGVSGGGNSEALHYFQSAASCLQLILRTGEYRFAWVQEDGISCIMAVLHNRCGVQLQYQMSFCLWLLAFSPQVCELLRNNSPVPALADVLNESVKEKVTRIVLAAFRNMLSQAVEKETRHEFALTMIQCKVLKQLENLEQQKFEDEDVVEDIKFMLEKLGESVHDLSSFDEYSAELKAGRLEWSPVHKSEKFWRENAARLNEKNYELLKILNHLLQASDDPQVLSVAAHDIGEYVRHYPRGKKIIEQLGCKQLVMGLMHHVDTDVRYNALLAVQKFMVHNWEYLGKQLQSQQGSIPTRS
uniref:V-type proton ATPase subunit H n=1 Tax=Petromyzon marinus TaxID=7757 RepID=A0AAJ7X1B1_PETMA|nr:V-type proton ATPase subunit H-like isoform X3 [Petromyzon marinus]